MSQIRKLQNGGTPKYGVLRIGNTVYDTPEAIDAFEGFLRAGDKSYAPITGKWMDYIRKGHDVSINPIDNTIEISGVSADDYSDLYGATKRQRRILESGKPTFGGNNFSTKFRDAVYYAGGFSYNKDAASKSNKNKVSNGQIEVDYDTIDGVQKYSNNPRNALISSQIKSYLDYLSDNKWGDTNEWEISLGDNDRILKAWYSGFNGNREAAEAAINAALAEVQSKPWNEVSEEARELLAYFNIVGPGGSKSTAQSVPTNYIDENGQVKKNTQNDKGQWGTYRGNGENGTIKDALYTTYNAGELPYLINADRLGLFEGLDNSYLNSVLYGGRFYRPDEVSQNVQLQKIMEDVARINNNATNAADLYNQLKGIINYTDYGDSVGNYLNYDSSQHYISNKAIREYLANTPYAAVFDATPAYGTDEGKIYGIYDFGKNGENPYGFRSPYYLVTDKDGNLRLNTNDQFNWSENDLLAAFDFLNRDYGNSDGLVYSRYTLNGKTYGRFQRTDVSGDTFDFLEDENGVIYLLRANGKIQAIPDELARKIVNGQEFTRNEISKGVRGRYASGGKIKELPLKLQGGSKLLNNANTIQDLGEINDPMSSGANGEYADPRGSLKWSDLAKEDRLDIEAAGLDIASAIAALVPGYGTAAAAGLGLTSSNMLYKSDKLRGKSFGKRAGNFAFNVGLDAASLLPFAGESAALAKIGKTIGRVGHLLIPVLNGAGLVVAANAAKKVIAGEKLTTDDYRALASGITSVLNIGHAGARRLGDASLTRTANKARTKIENVETPKHTKEVLIAEGEHPNAGTKQKIQLSETEVKSILNGEPKEAAPTLRKHLTETHKVAEVELPKDDVKLLKDWGFDATKQHQTIRPTKASRAAEGTIKEVVETPISKPSDKKSSYIRALFQNSDKRNAIIDDAIKNNEIRTGIDEARGEGFGFLGGENAYQRALKRTGETPTNWLGVARKQQMQEINETPTSQQNTDVQIPSGRSDERVEAQRIIESTTKGPEEIPAEFKPIEPLQLPTAERLALPNDTKEAAIMIRPETGLTKTGKSYKQASMEKRASNLRRLQKSMNPLKTLTDLEKQNSDKLFTNQEEFNAVLQEILRKNASTRGNNTKSGETYMRDVVSKLRSLRDSGRLYKNGGIIKGQIGIPDLKNPYWKNIISIGTQVPKGPAIPTAPAEVNSPNDPIKEHQQELLKKVADERTSKMGYNYRNWDESNYLIQPALSAFRYFSQKWGRNKMYDEQKAALNAGRVSRNSISLPTVPTYSTAHQHFENQLQQQMMNGIKPVASDLTAYYATKLQQQSGLNKALQELTAQKSNYEQQANVQNQQIKSQEALQNNEIAFENAKMRASINSGLHQLEAAKLGEEQASRDNLLYEIQQKLYQDQQLSNQVSTAKLTQKNAEIYQDLLQREFADEWTTWQMVDQTKYTDFEDYVRQTNPTKYNQKKAILEQRKQELDNDLIINSTSGKMNYPWLYSKSRGYHGPAGYLKGGRVNGKTRYTLEPDERIWIDNNKAAHSKSAKLNDAAIKLLLRALK